MNPVICGGTDNENYPWLNAWDAWKAQKGVIDKTKPKEGNKQ